jgi:ABC-type multidrug transport system fused ATPase/permease subunit
LVGPTGAGKTTLVDIILGLLTPQKGEFSVDGVKIDENNIINWQKNLGYVPQHIYLSDDTIMNNIAFGVPDEKIDREAVERAARISNLHDFIISELPNSYETIVGERGIRLSGGECQRVGIARALYHDPEVLVLDEATSSLDGITESVVLEAVNNIAKLKTIIIIAHRLTTVKDCDIIYLIDKGKIVAQGTYDELLSSNASFRAMARR